MTAVHAPPADGLQRAYDAWAPILVPALRTAPVWIDPSFASGLGPDFAEALSAAVADSPVDVRVAVGPEIERPPETDLTFYDRLFARLIDDLGHTGPLVFAYFTPSGRSAGVWSYASGPTGMSSRLTTRGEMSALRGSFVLDPRPHLDYCIAAGLHWLGDAEAPELSSYVDGRFGPEVASFFEMHRAGGVNALAAGTTFITAGAALAWVLMRRRAAAAAAGTGTTSLAGTTGRAGTSGAPGRRAVSRSRSCAPVCRHCCTQTRTLQMRTMQLQVRTRNLQTLPPHRRHSTPPNVSMRSALPRRRCAAGSGHPPAQLPTTGALTMTCGKSSMPQRSPISQRWASSTG